MAKDAFSKYHPAVCFSFFAGAIGFGVVIQHPAYLVAGLLAAIICYLLLKGRAGWRFVLGMIPAVFLISAINPLFNTQGKHILFLLFGRPYTLEALYYGIAVACVFAITLFWFGCYSHVMTSDKFTALFGRLIPALSLLVVMILRLIPALLRKASQISAARRAIGKGADTSDRIKQRLHSGMGILSALTDWALEGSISTADSMRARGYGTARRTSFGSYPMTLRDQAMLLILGVLILGVIFGGSTAARYVPRLTVAPLSWGFGAYCAYLAIPIFIYGKEVLAWHISKSKI